MWRRRERRRLGAHGYCVGACGRVSRAPDVEANEVRRWIHGRADGRRSWRRRWHGSGVGASLLHFDRAGSRVGQMTIDAPVLAIAVAGPDAIFVATATSLTTPGFVRRVRSTNRSIKYAGSGFDGSANGPAAGYLWLVRGGAVIQFDALLGLVPRATIVVPGPDAVGLDAMSGMLTMMLGGKYCNTTGTRRRFFTARLRPKCLSTSPA